MLEIFIFCFVLMYTPGPVNMISLFAGVSGQAKQTIGFCAGVGVAMALMFAGLGYLGSAFIPAIVQSVAALCGGLYIAWLGSKLMRSSFTAHAVAEAPVTMRFSTGLIMQLTNPKAMIVVLPVVTVHFPVAHIEGASIALMALALGLLAAWAPGTYLLLGSQFKRAMLAPHIMRWTKRVMSCMLWGVAAQFVWQSDVAYWLS